jgi:hypothetical protein
LERSRPEEFLDMLRAIAGSILGGLVAGAVAIVASAPARSTSIAPSFSSPVPSASVIDQIGSRATDPAMPSASSAAVVECEPHQRATLRRLLLDGREVAQVICTSIQPELYAGSDIVTAPVAARTFVERPVVVRERVVTREPTRRASTNRSWATSALIIGGGTGAGAGVGGLVSGKKGALVGAAIGGGSAAIFEAVKRR